MSGILPSRILERTAHVEVFYVGEGEDGAGGRSSNLKNATTEPEGGLAT
jgi:hypothetical protein